MIDKFDGVIIDYNSIILIINKLELYKENEEKIVSSIRDSLTNLDDYYHSDNSKILNNKKNNLCNMLDVMLNNRVAYIEYLKRLVNNYIAMNENTILNYQKYTDDIN